MTALEKLSQIKEQKQKTVADLKEILQSFDYYAYLSEDEKHTFDTLQNAIEIIEREM